MLGSDRSMSWQDGAVRVKRRRGRDSTQAEPLLEREAEQARIEEHLDAAATAQGGLVVIEGPAGTGKSRLVNFAGDLARQRDFCVLGAYGAELERDFPFGIAIQLFEPWWVSTGQSQRDAARRDGARAAVKLLTEGPASAQSDDGYSTIHGLFRLVTHIVEASDRHGRPAAIDARRRRALG